MNRVCKNRLGSLVTICSLSLIFFYTGCESAFSLPPAEETPVLTPEEAAQKIGQTVTLEGPVAGAFISPKTREHFFHYGDAYPKHSFSVRFDVQQHPDLRSVLSSAFVGRKVRVTGLVLAHQPVPTIILTDRADIQFMPVDENILLREDLDGKADWDAYAQAWRQKFQRKEFADIEKAASDLSTRMTLDGAGSLLLISLYNGLVLESTASPEDWKNHQALLEEWTRTYPESTTAWSSLANFWIAYSYRNFQEKSSDLDFSPGSLAYLGTPASIAILKTLFSNDKNGEDLYRERKNKAWEALETANKLKERCPLFYEALQRYYNNPVQGKPDLQKEVFERAIAYDPRYRPFYFNYAHYLRWFGEPGEWETFAATKTGPDRPDFAVRYAWLINAMSTVGNSGSSIFVKSNADWSVVKKGYEELRKRYPHSKWLLNTFAQFAGEANDFETARTLLPELENNLDMSVWCSYSNYDFFVKWTQAPGGPIYFH